MAQAGNTFESLEDFNSRAIYSVLLNRDGPLSERECGGNDETCRAVLGSTRRKYNVYEASHEYEATQRSRV